MRRVNLILEEEYVGEVRPQHGLVVGEERDGAEDELEETEERRRLRLWLNMSRQALFAFGIS